MELQVVVPPDAVSGAIRVEVDTETTTSSQIFTVLPDVALPSNLIDITTLEQLDAIRFDLNGDGTPTGSPTEVTAYEEAFSLSPGASVSCVGPCIGYELMNSLDFEDVASYASSNVNTDWVDPNGGTAVDGWNPIGDYHNGVPDNRFNAVFEGNSYMISNLYINRSSTIYVGLFGSVGADC